MISKNKSYDFLIINHEQLKKDYESLEKRFEATWIELMMIQERCKVLEEIVIKVLHNTEEK